MTKPFNERPRIMWEEFKPKGETGWGFDTQLRVIKYPSHDSAIRGVNRLRKQGWMIDTAYPTHDTHEVYAVKRVYCFAIKFKKLPTCEECKAFKVRCVFNHDLNRGVNAQDPAGDCFTGRRTEHTYGTRVRSMSADKALEIAIRRLQTRSIFGKDHRHFEVSVAVE